MEATSMERQLDEFDSIHFNSVFEVSLIQDTFNAIRIEGASKILDKISVTIQNNTLTLHNSYHGKWMHPKHNKIKVFLTVNKINQIKANETCNVTTSNTLVTDSLLYIMASKFNEAKLDINCQSFSYWNNFPCGGRLTLSGTTNSLAIWNVALMAIDASQLDANIAYCENTSKGDCKIKCHQQFNYLIKGEGNIFLLGNPPLIVDQGITGKGQLFVQ